MTTTVTNADLVERARRVLPLGVSSSNRVLPWPAAFVRAEGAYLTDADGRRYLDYHGAFGPLILGHNHPRVNAAVAAVLGRLDIVGAGVSDLEVELAETLTRHVPSAERVLFLNSGTEATYMAIRLARAVTGRNRLIKFQGTYHGWHDAVLMNVASPAEKVGRHDPLSKGMLPEVIDQTLVLPFNDTEAVAATLEQQADHIAAIIVEVIPHNVGCVLPRRDFLQALRDLCTRYGIVLIFDEVITGFRHAVGGYQSLVGITPDLTTFAKAMANGYPIAALVGQAAFMDHLRPGEVLFAGTYNGHPVGVTAALATIAELESGAVHAHCATLAAQVADGLTAIAQELGIPLHVARFGSVFVPYFMEPGLIESYTDLLRNNTARDVWFRKTMGEHGIFMIPMAMRRNHLSAAHTAEDVARTLDVARTVLKQAPAGS